MRPDAVHPHPLLQRKLSEAPGVSIMDQVGLSSGQGRGTPPLQGNSPRQKSKSICGNSLPVQWLELSAFTAGLRVQSLDTEVGSHKPRGTAKKQKDAFVRHGRPQKPERGVAALFKTSLV